MIMMKKETRKEMKAGEYTFTVWLRRWDDGRSITTWIVARDEDDAQFQANMVRQVWQLKGLIQLDGPEQAEMWEDFVDFDDLCRDFIVEVGEAA